MPELLYMCKSRF